MCDERRVEVVVVVMVAAVAPLQGQKAVLSSSSTRLPRPLPSA